MWMSGERVRDERHRTRSLENEGVCAVASKIVFCNVLSLSSLLVSRYLSSTTETTRVGSWVQLSTESLSFHVVSERESSRASRFWSIRFPFGSRFFLLHRRRVSVFTNTDKERKEREESWKELVKEKSGSTRKSLSADTYSFFLLVPTSFGEWDSRVHIGRVKNFVTRRHDGDDQHSLKKTGRRND